MGDKKSITYTLRHLRTSTLDFCGYGIAVYKVMLFKKGTSAIFTCLKLVVSLQVPYNI